MKSVAETRFAWRPERFKARSENPLTECASRLATLSIVGPTLLWENCQARGKLFLVLFFFFHFKSFSFFFFSTFLKLARLLRQCSGFNDLA